MNPRQNLYHKLMQVKNDHKFNKEFINFLNSNNYWKKNIEHYEVQDKIKVKKCNINCLMENGRDSITIMIDVVRLNNHMNTLTYCLCNIDLKDQLNSNILAHDIVDKFISDINIIMRKFRIDYLI